MCETQSAYLEASALVSSTFRALGHWPKKINTEKQPKNSNTQTMILIMYEWFRFLQMDNKTSQLGVKQN